MTPTTRNAKTAGTGWRTDYGHAAFGEQVTQHQEGSHEDRGIDDTRRNEIFPVQDSRKRNTKTRRKSGQHEAEISCTLLSTWNFPVAIRHRERCEVGQMMRTIS